MSDERLPNSIQWSDEHEHILVEIEERDTGTRWAFAAAWITVTDGSLTTKIRLTWEQARQLATMLTEGTDQLTPERD